MKVKQFKFSIIAGILKGRIITAPDLGITRPPLSRLRKSIFDFLNPYLDEADYLDLFSGTGSYLFEAVSRRAKTAVGVEQEIKLVNAINSQAEKLNIENQLRCICDDVFTAIPKYFNKSQKFDVIMIAPPQYAGLVDKTLELLNQFNILSPGGLIICQHDTSETNKINFKGFEISQSRKYGNTTFTILKAKK